MTRHPQMALAGVCPADIEHKATGLLALDGQTQANSHVKVLATTVSITVWASASNGMTRASTLHE